MQKDVINVCKKCIFSLILFSLVGSPLSLSFITQADAHIISGTVYTGDPDEGAGSMGIGRTVRIKVNGAGDFTDTTDASGQYSIDVGATAEHDILTVYLDGVAEKGNTVDRTDGSDINNLDIYQNHIIVRHETWFLNIKLMATYDYDQDQDILFDADISATHTLEVNPDDLFPDTVFYIWPGTLFMPRLGSAVITLDSLKIGAAGSYWADLSCLTTYVSGSWTNEGAYAPGVNGACDSVIFNASSNGTKGIISGGSAFLDLTFNDDGGGTTWVLEDALDVEGNLTITSGTLDVNTAEDNSINVEGNWTNSDTFLARNGLVTFDDDTPSSRTITSGGSAFYNLTFSPSNASTPTLVSTYTLEDNLDADNNLTISAGTLDTKSGENNAISVGGNWTNSANFTARNGTVTFDDDVANSRTITSGGYSFYNLEINPNPAATYTLEDTLDVDNNLTISSGTLDTKLGEDNTINIEGSWANSGTFLARNGYVMFNEDQLNTHTITSGGSSFYHFAIWSSGGATYILEDALDVDKIFWINGGTLDTKATENNPITVGGNWINSSSSFTAQSGTVTFDGTGAQEVTTGGSNWSGIVVTNASAAGVTFKDKLTCETFTCTTPDAHLNFKFKEVADEKFEITASGGLHLEGAVDHPILLRRYLGAEGDRWDIYPSGGSWTVNYVDVMDSINSYAPFIDPSNSLDSGNNYNWFEQAICITQIYPATSIALSGELIYFSSSNAGECGLEPSYRWEVASTIGSAINLDGIYASGNNDTGTPVTDTVTVTDIANSVTDTATVCVGDIDCGLTISPSSQTVSSGKTIQFSVDKSAECNLAESYSWKVSSTIGSSISSSGLYTAGSNNTPNDITETVTVTDSNNCVTATATLTVKGVIVITTTIPFTPTTTVPPVTTTIPSDTTTTTPLLTTTTTITPGCELTISPEAASVNPGETVTLEVSSTGDCDSPDYEWSLSSDTDSSIIPQGTTCIYTAGINDSSEPLTDIITLTDMTNGEISVSANITILPTGLLPSMTVSPGNMLRSRLLPIPVLMLIEGTNTHFDKKSSVISFEPVTSAFSLPPLVLNETTIRSLILVLPSWFATAEDNTVTVVVSTGTEVVSDTFEIEMLPSLLDE